MTQEPLKIILLEEMLIAVTVVLKHMSAKLLIQIHFLWWNILVFFHSAKCKSIKGSFTIN